MSIKQKAISTKNFVSKHRFAIGVTAGLALGLWINARNLKLTNEFLKEKHLLDEFYAIPEA